MSNSDTFSSMYFIRTPLAPDIEIKVIESIMALVRTVKLGRGCGKSTLLKLFLALYHAETGEIAIGEKEYEQMDYDEIRAHYAYVEQSPYLFHDTVAANIRGNRVNASLEEDCNS